MDNLHASLYFYSVVLLYFRYKTVYVMNQETNQTVIDVEVTNLWKDEIFATSVTWVHNLLRSVIPIPILCVLNYHIIRALRHTKSTRKKLSSRNRITVTLLVVVVVFVICITPDTIMTFTGLGYTDASYLARAIREITDLLLTINSSINFTLYYIFNNAFRRQFLVLFCKKCVSIPATRNMSEMDTSVYQSSHTNNSKRSFGSSLNSSFRFSRFSKRLKDSKVDNEVSQTLV